MCKHKTLNMGGESPEGKNTKCWFCLLDFCAEIHARSQPNCMSHCPEIYDYKNIFLVQFP